MGHDRDLKSVSADLRAMVESLRSDRVRHATHPADAAHAAAPSARPAPAPERAAPPRPAPEAGDLERRRLAAELAAAREELAEAAAERARVERELAEAEAERRRLSDEYVAVQEQATDLAQRYVALERIHGALSRAEVLAAVQEIVINLVGSEELALLERRGDGLALVQSFGIDPGPWREVAPRPGALATALSGATWIAGRDAAGPANADVSACVPLRAGGRVVGVLVIFRLLGHKPGLGEADRAVFELLSAHAGLALHLRPASGPAA